MKKGYYILMVFLAGCCYGILSTFVKLAYAAGFNLTEVAGAQCIIGTGLLWIAFIFTKKKKPSIKQVGKLLLSGIPLGLTSIFYYNSLKTLDASLAVVCLFQFVWMGALFETIVTRKLPSARKLVSIVILLCGSVMAAGVISKGAFVVNEGLVWGMLAAVTYTLTVLASGTVANDVEPVLKSALMATGAAILVLSFMPPVFLSDVDLTIRLLPYGLLLGFFGVTLPPFLLVTGMPYVGAGLGTILTSSELPVAVLMSLFVLGEQVALSQWLGILLILLGIINGQRGVRTE